MREYGKICTQFWTSPDIARLSDQGKLLAAYLLSSPHTNMIGCFRLPLRYISADLSWSDESVLKVLEELSAQGFVSYDSKLMWLVIHKFLKWNLVQNPNQGKAAEKLIEQVPSQSFVKDILTAALRQYAAHIPERLLNCSGTVLKPFGNQEQEQEQERKPEQKHKSVCSQPEGCLPINIVTLPLKDGSEFEVSGDQILEWGSTFKGINVCGELMKMRAWLHANPPKRKTRTGIARFCVNWLGRARGQSPPKRSVPIAELDHTEGLTETADGVYRI